MAPAKKAPVKRAAPKKTTTKKKCPTTGVKKLSAYQKYVKDNFHCVGKASSTAPERMALVAKQWRKLHPK